MTNDEQYLRDGGWEQDERGWWYPPHCMASFPHDDAMRMAKEDERRGLRMSSEEVKAYYSE